MELLKILCVFFLSFAGFSVTDDVKRYDELVITDDQKKDIHELITTLAHTSTVGLMFKKGELENLGKRTYGIHPLRYLGCIYADPGLKHCMPQLLKKSMVGSRFLKEISDGLNGKLDAGQLIPYVPGFSAELHLDEPQLMSFVHARDWKGMISYLNLH